MLPGQDKNCRNNGWQTYLWGVLLCGYHVLIVIFFVGKWVALISRSCLLFIHVILSLPSFTQKYLRAKDTGKRDLATSSCSGKPLCPYETETPLPPPSPTSSDTEPLVGRLLCPIRQHQQGPVGTTSAPDEPSTLEQ